MKVRFISHTPHTTQEIEFISEGLHDPQIQEITTAFYQEGWKTRPKQKLGSIIFERRGTGKNGVWTTSEKKSFLKEAKRVLKSFGFKSVPYQKLTIGDL